MKHLFKRSRIPALTTALFLILLLGIPFSHVLYSRPQNPYSILEKKFKVMNQILYYINQLYFEDVDMNQLMEGAFQGIMGELDPHSIYIPPKKQEEIDELFRGSFQGIGIEFDILHGYITVIAPIADSPSERAGLMPGDQIVEINGEDAYKITKEEVFKKLRGPKGTSVDLTIKRLDGERFGVTIVRDDIPIYSVRTALMLDEKTGYIWLTRFSATTSDEVRKAIEKLEAQGMQQLIFDLRNNSGGFLDQAAEISNLFIAHKDTLVYTKGKLKEAEQVFISDPSKGREDFPLIVLINRGSASASEIVAGAIQDLDRGLIAGETSFGKGLVQRQITLSDESAIRVTIARYYTPSGRLIQRPYKKGDAHDYYSDLYSENRESIIDSLKETRPKYSTRSGRTVYGGGGITPDVYLPWELKLEKATRKLLASPKRPLFNWSSAYTSLHPTPPPDYRVFRDNWILTEADYQDFLHFLEQEEVAVDTSELRTNREYLLTMLKSEIAGVYWGKDEAWGIRLQKDVQVQESLKHFDEAAGFLVSSQ